MRSRHNQPQRDEQIDVTGLSDLPALESYLFSPPSLAPSHDELEATEAAERTMDATEAPRRLGFGMRRSLTERLASVARHEEPVAAGSPEDPFATLLTPLSGPEMARLRAEVEADTILADRVERAGRGELFAQRVGLLGALALAVALGPFWFSYLRGLADMVPPSLLAEHLSADHARLGVYGLGVLVPLLLLGLLAGALADLTAGVLAREPGRFAAGFCVAALAALGLAGLDAGQLGVAGAIAVCGLVSGAILRAILRSSLWTGRLPRRGDGSPRR